MGVRRLYKATTPFNAVELRDIDFEQSNDTVFWAHLNHKPTQLVRRGHVDWEFSDVSFGPAIEPPADVAAAETDPNQDAGNAGDAWFPRVQRYAVASVDDASGQISLPSAEVTVTNDLSLKRNFNTVTWTANGSDRYFVYKGNLDGGLGFIGETTGTSFVDDNIEPDLTDGPRIGRDPFAIAGDYPSTVFFFEQRLGWARTLNNPNGMYLSRSADLFNHDVSRPPVEDDAITIRLVATKVNAINQVVPLDELVVLGSNGLFKVVGANQDYLAAAPPPRQRRVNSRGASRLEPIVADDTIFYTSIIGDDVRAANYSFEVDGYKSDNMAIFSPHFFKGFNIVAWAFAEEPLSCAWAVRDDGKMLVFTWEREHEVWGWTLCETDGLYLDVAVIPELAPGTDIAEHRAYVLVERTIAGVRRRFVERMSSAKWSDQKDACYLDCAASFDFDEPQGEIYVPHLAGATVDMLYDGNVALAKEVGADGYVSIPNQGTASRVHVGLRYTSLIETLPLAIPAPDGGKRAGKVQQIGKAVLRLVASRGLRAGRKLTDLFPLKTRRSEPLGEPKDLLTGDYLAATEPLVSTEATLFVEQRNPLPMTVTSIFLDPVDHEDG